MPPSYKEQLSWSEVFIAQPLTWSDQIDEVIESQENSVVTMLSWLDSTKILVKIIF